MSPFLLQATTTTTLLLAFLLLSPSTAMAADKAVDQEGDPLVAGSYYYAMPIAIQHGGGLTMFNKGSTSCPDFIVARSTNGDMDFGIPINFSPQSPIANENIYTSSNLNIEFKFLRPQPSCRRLYTKVWTVSTDTDTGSSLVVLDGEVGSDESLFTLEEYGDQLTGGYKILSGGKTVLYDVKESGEILLGLDSGNPLLVVFVKA